jgi:hypothetical protein
LNEPSPLRRVHPLERDSGIKSNRLSKIQELQDAHAVLAALDSTDKRLTAPDPVGHLLLTQIARSRRSFSKCARSHDAMI